MICDDLCPLTTNDMEAVMKLNELHHSLSILSALFSYMLIVI